MTRDEALLALGLQPGATLVEIRSAYKNAAQWCHPDKNPGNRIAEETFKRVSDAYRILCGPSERPWPAAPAPSVSPTMSVAPAPTQRAPARVAPSGAGKTGSALTGVLAFVGMLGVAFVVANLAQNAAEKRAAPPAPTPPVVAPLREVFRAAYQGPCTATRTALSEDSPLWCLRVRLENHTSGPIHSVSFGVYLTDEKTHEQVLLQPSSWGPARHSFSVSMQPGESIEVHAQGVTEHKIGRATPTIDDVWAG
jgi:hypothetical protein